jgi:hypothetical protein
MNIKLAPASFQRAGWTSCFVTGHGFSRATTATKIKGRASAPARHLLAIKAKHRLFLRPVSPLNRRIFLNEKTAGAEAPLHFTAIGPTKVVPCYKTLPVRPLDSGAGANLIFIY